MLVGQMGAVAAVLGVLLAMAIPAFVLVWLHLEWVYFALLIIGLIYGAGRWGYPDGR
jgi:hypothetical protein